MDISPTIQANSQQINADDVTVPATVTITNVESGSAEQPVFIHLAEFPGRTFRPAKSMRRVLVHAWGPEASNYIGRRLTLFNDPTIRFGKELTGGVRISHMSHIDGTLTIPLTVTRGRRAPFTVNPLPDAPPVDAARVAKAVQAIDAAAPDELTKLVDYAQSIGIANHPDVVAAIERKQAQ